MKSLAPVFAIFWAGLALGATLIATPAKFLAPSLTLPTALEIGRATFYWVGVAEAAICISFIIAILTFGGIRWRIAFVPIAIFAIQRLGLMPFLDARAIDIIAGNTVKASNLHDIYIYLECAKVFALMAVGAIGIFFVKHDKKLETTPSSTKEADGSEENHSYSRAGMQVTFVDGALQFA